MKNISLLAVVIATTVVNVRGQNTYYDLTCQTSGASPSATDLNNMGMALQSAPQATTQYCSGDNWVQNPPNCVEAADYFTAAVDICSQTGNTFCIYGSELGHWVQELAITCRNGNNLSGGKVWVKGSDGNVATVEVYHK